MTLEFSNAAANSDAAIADYARLTGSIYSDATRQRVDPLGNVIDRDPDTFYAAIFAHRVAFLSDVDNHGRVVAATAAYKSVGTRCAEIGSSLKDLPQGFDGGKLVVAAAALAEAVRGTPCLVAAIGTNNDLGLKSYAALGWKDVTDPKRIRQLFEITRKPPKTPKVWVECDRDTLKTQALLLQKVMKDGGLENDHTGEFLPVNLSALRSFGLTADRLQDFVDRGTPNFNTLPAVAAPL